MSSSVSHKISQSVPAGKEVFIHSNGIVRSFVARRKKYLFLKRSFDILFSAMIIICCISWLLPLIALLIITDSKGPVFFRQKRVGKNGCLFYCLKFRTMKINAEADERPAEKDDDRITRIGRILRRTNLDELPQFFNVFSGHMSVVGPRPHMVSDCIRFSFIISSYSFRHQVRPGITGWAQVHGYHGPSASYESILIRYYWDAQYIRKASIALDIKIVWKTITRVFAKEPAFSLAN